jgi:hypothetical protein
MAAKGDWRSVGYYVSLVRGTTYDGRLVGKPGPALLGLGSIEPAETSFRIPFHPLRLNERSSSRSLIR